LFIADAGANAIIQASSNGSSSSILPITTSVPLNAPNALAIVGTTLYISDSGNTRILAVPTTGGSARVLRSTVTLSSVSGLAALPGGNLLVVDAGNGGLIQLNPTSGVASVLVTYDAVGNLFTTPDTVAVSPDGSTFFVTMSAGSANNKYSVVEMSSNGGNISSIATDVIGIGGIAMSSSGKLADSAVRGVFTAQFHSTPSSPVVVTVPSKSGVVATWTPVTAWDGAWTYTATVAKAVGQVGAPITCTVGSTGCTATGLLPSTKYVLTVTVNGFAGTTSAVNTYAFTTPAK
jgi:hypothetical protein